MKIVGHLRPQCAPRQEAFAFFAIPNTTHGSAAAE